MVFWSFEMGKVYQKIWAQEVEAVHIMGDQDVESWTRTRDGCNFRRPAYSDLYPLKVHSVRIAS